jgi:hypothetical protein
VAIAGEGPGDYHLVLTPPARRALMGRLPEAVAAAVIGFLSTALIQQPYAVWRGQQQPGSHREPERQTIKFPAPGCHDSALQQSA